MTRSERINKTYNPAELQKVITLVSQELAYHEVKFSHNVATDLVKNLYGQGYRIVKT